MKLFEKTNLAENDRNYLIAVTSAWRHTEEFWEEMIVAIEDDETIITVLNVLLFLYRKDEDFDALNLLYSYCKILDFDKFPFDILYDDKEYGMLFLNEFLAFSLEHLAEAMEFDIESGEECAC